MTPETQAAIARKDTKIAVRGMEMVEVVEHLRSIGCRVPVVAVGGIVSGYVLTVLWPDAEQEFPGL